MDESQWLPKGIPIITPQRQAMLNIDVEYDDYGQVKYAKAQIGKTILQFLHKESIIDDQEYHDGRDYEFWREMFRAFCSAQRMTASYDKAPTSGEGDGNREYGYLRIIRILPPPYQNYINYAIDNQATPALQKLARYESDRFQRVFNRLGAVMKIVREEMQEDA